MDHFEDVKGYKEIKTELEFILDIMISPEKYKKLGVTIPKGLLLHGAPGVGKSLMATCFIKASNRKAFVCKKNKPNGFFVEEIKKIFDEAKANTPSIVLLEDMDKFANEDNLHRNAEEYVTIQSCIDDLDDSEVFVIATANDTENLPDSLVRAGRFDKTICVKPPCGKDAEEIVRYYLSEKKYVSNIDAAFIAKLLNGRSCAELEAIINEAGVYAGYNDKNFIDMNDIIEAFLRVVFNAPKKLDYDKEVIERIAYHEAGHAVISEILESESVILISVRPSVLGRDGVTIYYQDDKKYYGKKEMNNNIITHLGGKAAIEIVFGDTDLGVYSDMDKVFRKVSHLAVQYCATSFDKRQLFDKSSEQLLSRKELFVSNEVERYYMIAKSILINNREFLEKIAKSLIEKQTLIGAEVAKIKKECTLRTVDIFI